MKSGGSTWKVRKPRKGNLNKMCGNMNCLEGIISVVLKEQRMGEHRLEKKDHFGGLERLADEGPK